MQFGGGGGWGCWDPPSGQEDAWENSICDASLCFNLHFCKVALVLAISFGQNLVMELKKKSPAPAHPSS